MALAHFRVTLAKKKKRRSKSRGPQCTKVPQTHLNVFFSASVSQLFHWLLHQKQFTEEDFPLPLYAAAARISVQRLWVCYRHSVQDLVQ